MMTSMSFDAGTGLKKCRPQIRSGCPVTSPTAWASSSTDIEDVFVLSQASVPTTSALSSAAVLMPMSSGAASMTRLHPGSPRHRR